MYVLLLLISCIRYLHGQDVDPCEFEMVTDFGHGDCDSGFFYYFNDTRKNCFPTCIKDIENIEEYDCDEWNPCPPGYLCKIQNIEPEKATVREELFARCKIDENSCFKYHANYPNNIWFTAEWKPECLENGEWAPKQCKGESSNARCFCFDALGKRLFGQEFSKKTSNMTCACSRQRDKLMKSGNYTYASLHCDSVGNYEALQCNAEQCWCVEKLTGKIISEVIPETLMKFLPCYSQEIIGDNYLRQCESAEYAQAKILKELDVHGTKGANFAHVMCDADGSYGAYEIVNGIAECRWRDNSNLNAGGSISVYTDIDCNCVRDRKIFEKEGLSHNMFCAPTGNYRPDQVSPDGKFYCVDSEGFRKSPYSEQPQTCSEYV